MKVQRLDHVALYMSNRSAAAEFLTSYLGFHVIDHTNRYTLVGAGGRLGKLTLFDAPEGTTPSPEVIERINVRVADPEAASFRLPQESNVRSQDGEYLFDGPEGLPLALVPGANAFTDYDLEGVLLRSGDPEAATREFVKMGFAPGEDVATVKAGEYRLRLVLPAPTTQAQGMLYHIGCLWTRRGAIAKRPKNWDSRSKTSSRVPIHWRSSCRVRRA